MIGLDRRDIRLTINLVKMMVRDRYLGSMLGGIWAILNPVMLLALFTFVFGFVFKTKLPGSETTFAYAIWLIAGYGPWIAITEGIISGATTVVGNSHLIKNLSFKAECLPLAAVLSSGVSLAVSIVFLVGLLIVDGHTWTIHILLIPVTMVLQFILISGIALLLASVNVFMRDIALVLPNIMLVLLFTSPIFYPLDMFPEAIRGIVAYNPFAIIVDGYRNGLIYSEPVALSRLVFLIVFSVGAFMLGLGFFRRLKPHFDARL